MALLPGMDDGTLTVGEISRRVERALRRELPPTLWVRGEIHDLNRASSGHVWFRLTGDGCALPVVLWSSDKATVNGVLKRAGNAVRMEDGTEVRIRVEVGWFAKRGELSLRMLTIDPAFTLGQLAAARAALLARLRAEGLLARQGGLALAAVPLRVALVTSLGSDAHADVRSVLAASGYAFEVAEHDARVQGADAPASVVAALARAAAGQPDVVLLVRGGGARTDLAAFDDEALARAIAACPVPVVAGIGHESDTSVADDVAHRRAPTPTGAATFLVERVRAWCDRRDAVFDRLCRAADRATERAAQRLEQSAGRAAGAARHHVVTAGHRLDHHAALLERRVPAVLDAAGAALTQRAARIASADPSRLLARGWSITTTGSGELVRGPADAPPGTMLRTRTAGGELESVVVAP